LGETPWTWMTKLAVPWAWAGATRLAASSIQPIKTLIVRNGEKRCNPARLPAPNVICINLSQNSSTKTRGEANLFTGVVNWEL